MVTNIEEVPEGAPLFDRHMVDLVRTLNRAYRCVSHELWETRRCLNLLQCTAAGAVSAGWVRHEVLYGDNIELPHDAAMINHRFPPVYGEWAPPAPGRSARMSIGLHVPCFPCSEATRQSLLGSPMRLSHPDAPEDTSSPNCHLLDVFLHDFARAPYDERYGL